MGASGVASRPNLHCRITSNMGQSLELYDYHQKANNIEFMELIQSDIKATGYTQSLLSSRSQELDIARLIQFGEGQNGQLVIQSFGNAKAWKVIRQKQQQLLVKDKSFKIGKVILKLKEIVTSLDHKYQQQQSLDNNQSVKSAIGDQGECRICFGREENQINPLISLCNCSGSMRFTHYKCLKDWFCCKFVTKKSNDSCFILYRTPFCQICKSEMPSEFEKQGKLYSLFDFQSKKTAPYAIFQVTKQEEKQMLVVQFFKNEITVGRNSGCDVIITDISVSRTHCALIYKGHNLFLEDRGSKFGTLSQLQSQLQFDSKSGFNIQLGSKLLEIYEQNKCGVCCCIESQRVNLRWQQSSKKQIVSLAEEGIA